METGSNRTKSLKGKRKPKEVVQEQGKPQELVSDSDSQCQLASTDILNDDDLLMIFSYLPIKELIKIERVSKKWRKLSLMSWINIKKVNLGHFFENIEVRHLKDIVKRGGDYLTHLDLYLNSKTTNNEIFSSINLCTNLTHLYLYMQFDTGIRLSYLSESLARNLKSLKIGKDLGLVLTEVFGLSDLLKKAAHLEEFMILIRFTEGSSLVNLSETCKKLSIRHCQHISDKTLEETIKQLPYLEHLDISSTFIKAGTLASVSRQLISLDLSYTKFFFCDNSYKNLSFPNLRTLILFGRIDEDVNDAPVFTLIDRCPLLEELSLDGKFDDECSFRQLAKLQKLTYLDLARTNITDDSIKYLAPRLENLKRFRCFEDKEKNYANLLPFIEFCSKLECLDTRGLEHFSSEFFLISEKYVRKRSSQLPLKIRIDVSFYSDSDIQREMKRLQLELLEPRNAHVNRCRAVLLNLLPKSEFKREAVWGVNYNGK